LAYYTIDASLDTLLSVISISRQPGYPKLYFELFGCVLETLPRGRSTGKDHQLSDLFISEPHIIDVWNQITQFELDGATPGTIFYTREWKT
jgi:hypothetical protein